MIRILSFILCCTLMLPVFAEQQDSAPIQPMDVSNVKNAIPKPLPYSAHGNPTSYTVNGKTYHVLKTNVGYESEGFEEINKGTYGKFSLPQAYAKFFIDKGYVALDGMSLTIAHLDYDYFLVAFIPHTVATTNVQSYQANQLINIEVDMVGKYLQRFIQVQEYQNA